jgi:hypothetical protein
MKSLMYLLTQRIKMKFLKVSFLTQDRHFWVFAKETIINMTLYAGLNIPQWWSFTIFIIQLLLHLWQRAIYAILTSKRVKVGVVRFALIMMYAILVIRRMGVWIILISWRIIHPWQSAMHRTRKLGNRGFCRYNTFSLFFFIPLTLILKI